MKRLARFTLLTVSILWLLVACTNVSPTPVNTPAVTTSSLVPTKASTLVATSTSPSTVNVLATSTTQPTLLPAISSVAATPTLPVVEDVIGLLPTDCQVSQLSPKEVSKSFGGMAGGPAVGFVSGTKAIISLGEVGLSLSSTRQTNKQYGWATKILWLMEPGQQEPVTLTWRNQADGTPAWFFMTRETSRDAGKFTTTPILEPNPETYYEWTPSNVFFPKAGCYILEANWKGGNWKLTFAVGRTG